MTRRSIKQSTLGVSDGEVVASHKGIIGPGYSSWNQNRLGGVGDCSIASLSKERGKLQDIGLGKQAATGSSLATGHR